MTITAATMSHEAIDLTTLLFTVPIAWVLVMAFAWMVRKEPKCPAIIQEARGREDVGD